MTNEVVDLICGQRMPQKVDFMFLHHLKESELVNKHPHAVINLLTALIAGILGIPGVVLMILFQVFVR